MHTEFSYLDEGETKQESEEANFGPIIVDVHAKELYAAIEQYCRSEIEGFKTPNVLIGTNLKSIRV
jgi:hypothetical protein